MTLEITASSSGETDSEEHPAKITTLNGIVPAVIICIPCALC
jgi:hypothetical protein